VGGMSAQPGPPVGPSVEAARVVPVVRALRAATEAPISVDTYRAAVADAALAAGADLVNDHTGLSDGELAAVVAAHRAGLVVTHLELDPKAAQGERYDVPFERIAAFLAERT